MFSDALAPLFLALGIFALGFISIGPNLLAIMGTSMARGRASGVRLALGVAAGSALWACLTVAGLTALLTAYAVAATLLKIFGAGYLLWLAFRALRSAATSGADLRPAALAGDRLFLKGLLIQMTNPKAALHWVAIVGLGLGAEAPLWLGLILIVSATALSAAGHLAYALIFSTTRAARIYGRARRWIDGALGVFFAVAAWKVAAQRI